MEKRLEVSESINSKFLIESIFGCVEGDGEQIFEWVWEWSDHYETNLSLV